MRYSMVPHCIPGQKLYSARSSSLVSLATFVVGTRIYGATEK